MANRSRQDAARWHPWTEGRKTALMLHRPAAQNRVQRRCNISGGISDPPFRGARTRSEATLTRSLATTTIESRPRAPIRRRRNVRPNGAAPESRRAKESRESRPAGGRTTAAGRQAFRRKSRRYLLKRGRRSEAGEPSERPGRRAVVAEGSSKVRRRHVRWPFDVRSTFVRRPFEARSMVVDVSMSLRWGVEREVACPGVF